MDYLMIEPTYIRMNYYPAFFPQTQPWQQLQTTPPYYVDVSESHYMHGWNYARCVNDAPIFQTFPSWMVADTENKVNELPRIEHWAPPMFPNRPLRLEVMNQVLSPTTPATETREKEMPKRVCYNCKTKQTTLWRRNGPYHGCNACVLYKAHTGRERPHKFWAKPIRIRFRTYEEPRTPSPGPY